MQRHILHDFRSAQDRVNTTIKALEQLQSQLGFALLAEEYIAFQTQREPVRLQDDSIYNALLVLSPSLANSYSQVIRDIEDESRSSWVGTANEIREVLRVILDTLAPDDKVKKQTWYQQQDKTTGPTRKQKVKYIMEQYEASSREKEATEKVGFLDLRIEDLISAVYDRANDATHRSKNRTEILRILNYFEAFAHDLLNLS